MKEIKVKKSQLKTARRISDSTSSITLLQIGPRQFALDGYDCEITFGFESKALAVYLDEQSDLEIFDVRVIELKVLIGVPKHSILELHLVIDTEEKLILDLTDRITKTKTVYDPIPRMAELISPFKMWGIPPSGKFARMLLTGRLVDNLEELNENGHFRPLLHILWKEYEMALADNAAPDEKIIIDGEFMVFSVKTFNQVLVVFDCA